MASKIDKQDILWFAARGDGRELVGDCWRARHTFQKYVHLFGRHATGVR
ncbi:hypothetical protein T190_00505 [Sinorhizobium meliloti CCBAU 01290]|nr:hypothetical protein T190_00505 [Sinorhizobium meliloti CCBAU 01290]